MVRRRRSDITCIIGCQAQPSDQPVDVDRLTLEHRTGDAYAAWIVGRLVLARRVAGSATDDAATVVRCARIALRLVLDDLLAMCESGSDGPDRLLLCDAAMWLETLSAAPEAWRAEP